MGGVILTNEEITEVKKRAETQFNWANTSVLSLVATIESLQKTIERLMETQITSRKAFKETLSLLFDNLEDEKGIKFTKEQLSEAIEKMHDDSNFFECLLDFFKEHIEGFGENYGLD
jgi:hypothetical protein